MSELYYDLHIHSCLSPCGDNDSTPDSIAGMGELNGLDVMALTDHNSAKNCPAFFKAARRHGIVPVAGMELTTAEDIHMLCLFEELDAALAFDADLQEKRILIRNKTEIFGDQLILNEFDELVATEENLLINATAVSLEEAPGLVKKYGGVCIPAHIDREANGIIAVLGAMPESPKFRAAELNRPEKLEEYAALTGIDRQSFLVNSDAHTLWNIKEKREFLSLDCEKSDPAEVRRRLFTYLRSAV